MTRRNTTTRRSDQRIAAWLIFALLVALASLPGIATADQESESGVDAAGAALEATDADLRPTEESDVRASKDPVVVVYVPPRGRGRAQITAGAGTRGRTAGVQIAALAPRDHVALTTRAQPTLYWFVSEPTSTRIDVTVVDEDSIDPLLELTLPEPVEAGIHALELEELDLSLDPDKTYYWYVSLVTDPERRASDVIAGGAIVRTTTPGDVDRALAEARFRYAPYASSGIWYDAMDELLRAIERDPGNEGLRLQRHALLEQVELSQVAVYTLGVRR